MSGPVERLQRIGRLAPLPEIDAAVDRCSRPVAALEVDVVAAAGRVLAADIFAATPLPARPVALRDGFAVASEWVADAGPYAPVPLAPPPRWVDCGDPLPDDCDAVLPPDALTFASAGSLAIATVAPGEGVIPAGFDASAQAPLYRAGTRLRPLDVSILRAAGAFRVAIRAPHIGVIVTDRRIDAATDTVGRLVVAAITVAGGDAACVYASDETALARAVAAKFDAFMTIGGTGEGRKDHTAHAVAAAGELLIHGMGIRPGESAGFGRTAASRPVLLLPGRLDAALAVWLLVGRRLLGQLTGAMTPATANRHALARKIVSTVGLAEVVLVKARRDGVEPIAAGVFPLQALARACGWVLVPPESEGYAAGASVEINALP